MNHNCITMDMLLSRIHRRRRHRPGGGGEEREGPWMQPQ